MVGLARILPLCAVLLLPAFKAAYCEPAGTQWVIGSPMVSAHGNTALVTLQDGRLLVVSGNDGIRLTTVSELTIPQLANGLKLAGPTRAGMLSVPHSPAERRGADCGGARSERDRLCHGRALRPRYRPMELYRQFNTSRRYTVLVGLKDGRVLAATGAHGPPDGSGFLSTAELYDPATGQWTFTASALRQRESASGILLNDGRVLLLGGYSCCDVFHPVTELYDPVSGTWSRAGDLPSGRSGQRL